MLSVSQISQINVKRTFHWFKLYMSLTITKYQIETISLKYIVLDQYSMTYLMITFLVAQFKTKKPMPIEKNKKLTSSRIFINQDLIKWIPRRISHARHEMTTHPKHLILVLFLRIFYPFCFLLPFSLFRLFLVALFYSLLVSSIKILHWF